MIVTTTDLPPGWEQQYRTADMMATTNIVGDGYTVDLSADDLTVEWEEPDGYMGRVETRRAVLPNDLIRALYARLDEGGAQ